MSCNCAALPIAANSTVNLPGPGITGFACVATGTLTITRRNENGTDTVILNAMPVTAGQWIDLPFYVGQSGLSTATTAGGAAGTFALN